MKTLYVSLTKNNIDEYWKKHYRFINDLALYCLFFKNQHDDSFVMRSEKKDGAVVLLDMVTTANAHSAINQIKRSFALFNNLSGFFSFEKKIQGYNAVLYPFDGEFPCIYNPESTVYQDIKEPFAIISYVAAGYTVNPINPNLISSWGYSFQ